MEQSSVTATHDIFTVIAWNILLDKARTRDGLVRPQADRIDLQADTLKQTELDLDVVAILEAEQTEAGHNGEKLARRLGYTASHWTPHNRKNEYIGMFGGLVDGTEPVDIGHRKKAVLTHVGSVAVVGVHLRRERWGGKRAEQMGSLLEHIDQYDQAVVMGDLNAIPIEKAPRILRAHGFQSVYRRLGKRRPPTWPTDTYRGVMLNPWYQWLLGSGVVYDDIYVKNVDVLDAGSFVGDSDHAGVWAVLRP